LQKLLASDPYRRFRLRPNSKRIVTFLRRLPRATLPVPVELDGARILAVRGREVLSAYTPNPRGPVFMQLIEKTLGKEVTSRTWETVIKVGNRGSA
jgi:hypothetical protein